MKPSYIIATIIIGTVCALLLLVFINAVITGQPLTVDGREISGKVIVSLLSIASFILGKESNNWKPN